MSKICLFSNLFISAVFASSLYAEDRKNSPAINLDSITITGEKPAIDSPINAPLNFTEFDRETINELGFTRAQDVAGYVPNYNLIDASANGFSDRSSLRGLTNTPVFTTPSILMYVDDIPYLSASSYTNQLVGVDSIEVYRGPQAGLFARNSYAGVINVKSRRPGNQLQSHVSVDKGNFDSLTIDSYFAGALVKDQLYLSVGSIYSKRDEYLNNTFLNSKTDTQDHLSGNVSVLWTPDLNWEVNFKANLEDFNDGGIRLVSLSSDDLYQIQSAEPEKLDQNANSQALKISYQNQQFEILSVTAKRDSETAYDVDFDRTPQQILFQQSDLSQQQWSQEFRLKSLDETVWRWSLGFLFSTNEMSGNQINTVMLAADNLKLKTLAETAYAGFGQISYQGFESIRMYLDLRLDYVEKAIDSRYRNFTGLSTRLKDDKNDFFASPKLTLDYTIFPHITAHYTTGLAFRPGGYTPQSNTFPEYKKETMWHNEIGIRGNWLDEDISADLTFFYYDIDNYQLEEQFTTTDYAVINANKVTSYGVELSAEARLSDMVKITGGFAYTRAKFNDYFDPFNVLNISKQKVPYVPAFNVNISGLFKHPSGVFARMDFLWTGKTYFYAANSDPLSEQDYTVLNVHLGYQYKYFSINAYVKNLSESNYVTQKIASLNVGVPGAPRTFGARMSIDF